MNYIKQFQYGFLLAALFLCAGTASAQTGRQIDGPTSVSNLAVSANFQTTLKLDITTATAGVTVDGVADSGTFSMDLGDVNGLGIGTPASNVTITAVSGGFTYTTPITLTPTFTGFTNSVALITVGQDPGDSANEKDAAREGAAAATVAVLPATLSARTVTATAASDTPFDRYIGVFVKTGNGGVAVAGARTMSLVYTITVP